MVVLLHTLWDTAADHEVHPLAVFFLVLDIIRRWGRGGQTNPQAKEALVKAPK